jgi:hypothetical protein
MVKRKRTNGETIIYKILHSKLEIERHDPTINQVWTHAIQKGEHWLLDKWDITHVYNAAMKEERRTGLWLRETVHIRRNLWQIVRNE